jgi:hypothetical protein
MTRRRFVADKPPEEQPGIFRTARELERRAHADDASSCAFDLAHREADAGRDPLRANAASEESQDFSTNPNRYDAVTPSCPQTASVNAWQWSYS